MTSINSVVSKFQDLLTSDMSFTFSGGKRILGRKGIPNRLFCVMLCQNKKHFVDFLKEAGLILSELLCEKCKVPMSFSAKISHNDGFNWICRNKCDNKICGSTKTIRQHSWFYSSKLKMEEIFLLTYEFVKGTETKEILMEYDFSCSTLSGWRMFVNDLIFHHVKQTSQKIGGDKKVVESDFFKFGSKKNNNKSEDQYIFLAMERETKKLVLVPLPDKTEETLIDIIKEWIEPETTLCLGYKITDGWLGDEGCEHLTVKHKISFVESIKRQDLNLMFSTWRHVKSVLPPYNRQTDIKYFLAKYLFEKSCKEKGVNSFIQFLEIIRNVNWAETQPNQKL